MKLRWNVPHDGRRRKIGGFTLVELMIVVAILGILAAIAIPTVMLYIRRTKTAEARQQIAKMFDSTVAFFRTEHVDRGDVDMLGQGGQIANNATHRCPHPSNQPTGGSAGFTPNIDCNLGPGGRCVPAVNGAGPGYYDMSLWDNNPVWNGLNFAQEQGHYFHYDFVASNGLSGFGSCQFTAQAFGDLDADSVYSTFERSGGADVHGVNAAAGLYIDQVVE